MQSKQKVLSVEGIRGWACFMVLLSHLSLTFFPYLHSFQGKADASLYPIQAFIHESPLGFFFSGTSAVFIFFVLSGYILTKVALKEGQISQRILSMSLKRYPRLMIPALVSCLLTYICFVNFDTKAPELGQWINSFGNEQNYSLTHAIFDGAIDVFFLSGQSVYNPVLWTMKVELLGSFIIYLLCLNRISTKIPYLTAVFFILTVVSIVTKFATLELALGIISFYGGYLFANYGREISTRFALLLLIIGLYLAGAHSSSLSYWPINQVLRGYTYFLSNFLSGFFIVYAFLFNHQLSRYISGKLSVFLGKVSFSVYLIQMPIIITFTIVTFNLVFAWTAMYNLSAIIVSIASIIFIYTSSILYYHAVDAQGMKFSNLFANTLINLFKRKTNTQQLNS